VVDMSSVLVLASMALEERAKLRNHFTRFAIP
jgi:hypothetical protein